MISNTVRDVAVDNLTLLTAITVLTGDGNRKREVQFLLAGLLHAIGSHTRIIHVEFVLYPFTLLRYMKDRCGDITSTVDDALVVESAISKREFGLKK